MANIGILKEPISVNIAIENSVLLPDAFNSIGFLTYNEKSPRSLVVNKLDDLLNNGFTRDSKAYNFCYGVFLQGRLNNIVIRSVRENESYYDAYISDNNSSYYYLVIESKDVNDVINFTSKVSDQLKLVFYSSNEDHSSKLSGLSNLVFYYNTNIGIDKIDGWLMFDDGSFALFDDGSSVEEEVGTDDESGNLPSKVITCDATNNSGGDNITKQSLTQGSGYKDVSKSYLYISLVDEYLNTIVPEYQVPIDISGNTHYTYDSLTIALNKKTFDDGFTISVSVQNRDVNNYKLVKFRYVHSYVNSNSSLKKQENSDGYVCLKPYIPQA